MQSATQGWTLPGWARPVCEGIVANAAMGNADKYDAIVHNLGLANGVAGAEQPAERKKGLTNDYMLELIPGGRRGIKTDDLRTKLAAEGFDGQQINLAIGRVTRGGKYAVEQNGVLFRAPVTATGAAPTEAERTDQSAEQQTEAERRAA